MMTNATRPLLDAPHITQDQQYAVCPGCGNTTWVRKPRRAGAQGKLLQSCPHMVSRGSNYVVFAHREVGA